jgi:hypothetical protein
VSLHKYLYANASPLTFIDPTGEVSLGELMTAISIRVTLAVARVAPWILRGSKFIPTIPFLYKLANSPVSGPTVQVVTKLTQFPQASRQLSCAIGENAEALANAARTTGTLFRANIPQELFEALTNMGWATQATTLMGDVVGTEVVFAARAMEFILKFFH